MKNQDYWSCMQIHVGWEVGTLHFCLILKILSDPVLHETIKICPTVPNQYCYWPVVELKNEDI